MDVLFVCRVSHCPVTAPQIWKESQGSSLSRVRFFLDEGQTRESHGCPDKSEKHFKELCSGSRSTDMD